MNVVKILFSSSDSILGNSDEHNGQTGKTSQFTRTLYEIDTV